MAAAGDGLALSGAGLSLSHRGDRDKLQRLIGRAMALAQGNETEPAGTMRALRPSGKRPFSILISPLYRGELTLTMARSAVCIVIADPEREPDLPGEILRANYGLTPAEFRLAAKIASGKSLQQAAEELGISDKTVRSQLAVIFRKTSTARQGELVKLLLSELPVI